MPTKKPTVITTHRFSPAKIAYVALFLAATATFVWLMKPEPATAPAASVAVKSSNNRTVGDAWQWDKFTAADRKSVNEAPPGKAPPLFTVAGVHEALRQVELNEQGEIVVDAKTLSLLQNAFNSLKTNGTPAQLEELQQIIKSGLPGAAGEQAAKIVRDYHQYHVALQELQAASARPEGLPAAANHYEQLITLRQQYLGYDTAEKLFGEEQALARHTFASIQIQMSPTLTEQQKQQMLQQLQARLPSENNQTSPEWNRRYAVFQQQRQAVLNAGLSEAEKQAQIERLLREHFREDEIEAARSYLPGQGG